ncbi:S-adenosyl-L-methionine-dependent methyltransferase [Piptocephalis cylindrospora]|uniref:S-adenosyl-L-methionine-dependent methyltransferase n=1 Tax=Piptocephalis cylindrospora TaxID=1907219 RepID=A0A4P9XZQ1_9FUNG|nr:S-adenosyl-L-methionine-dependent methyltransferase [Piptocephalis cylindrospora]|eukprot:RKP11953.1 S-adenosyl-L-methionine-dependent methyltransferase [Piptocephalis cylindrospora]
MIFDRAAKRRQRDRAAQDVSLSRQTDYLRDEVAARVVDRLLDIKRRFPVLVDLGAGAGHMVKHLESDLTSKVIQLEYSRGLGERDVGEEREVEVERVVADEEALPFEPNSLDAVISSMSLHWINDLPGTLSQVRHALKPDGVFLGAMLGGDTLYEARVALQLAETERLGGISPRVSPMTNVSDMGQLLSRAGLTLTTVDVDEVVVRYPSLFELMTDLHDMGESNSIINRRPYLSRDVMMAASSIYQEMYGSEDGTIPATFQILYLIGWKPDPSQPKPLARGSAKASLKETL